MISNESIHFADWHEDGKYLLDEWNLKICVLS